MRNVLCLFIAGGLFFSCSSKSGNREYLDLFQKGKMFYLNKDLSRAIPLFEESIAKNSRYLPAHIMLGKSYYYSRDPGKAVRVFRRLLSMNRNCVSALSWLIRIEGIDQKNHKKGLEYCDRILRLDMENYTGHLYKAMILEEQGRVKEAIIEYHYALELEKVVYLARLRLADLYLGKGLKERGIEELNRVLRYDIDKDLKNEIEQRLKKYEKK